MENTQSTKREDATSYRAEIRPCEGNPQGNGIHIWRWDGMRTDSINYQCICCGMQV